MLPDGVSAVIYTAAASPRLSCFYHDANADGVVNVATGDNLFVVLVDRVIVEADFA